MITMGFYENKMRDAILLLDAKLSKKSFDLIYEKIQENYENEDLEKAIDAAVDSGKLSYPFILDQLRTAAAIRREQENIRKKRQEEENARQFWKANYQYIQAGICGRQCRSCRATLCNLIAQAAISGVKSILSAEKTINQVFSELSSEFPGAGFEKKPNKEV